MGKGKKMYTTDTEVNPVLFTFFQMVDIYDCALGLLRIGPFNYEPHAGVELLLQQTDDVILQCLSTTPEVEGPSWVKMVR